MYYFCLRGFSSDIINGFNEITLFTQGVFLKKVAWIQIWGKTLVQRFRLFWSEVQRLKLIKSKVQRLELV